MTCFLLLFTNSFLSLGESIGPAQTRFYRRRLGYFFLCRIERSIHGGYRNEYLIILNSHQNCRPNDDLAHIKKSRRFPFEGIQDFGCKTQHYKKTTATNKGWRNTILWSQGCEVNSPQSIGKYTPNMSQTAASLPRSPAWTVL